MIFWSHFKILGKSRHPVTGSTTIKKELINGRLEERTTRIVGREEEGRGVERLTFKTRAFHKEA